MAVLLQATLRDDERIITKQTQKVSMNVITLFFPNKPLFSIKYGQRNNIPKCSIRILRSHNCSPNLNGYLEAEYNL